MILSIIDFDMTQGYDVVREDSEPFDIKFACNHQVVSNLVRSRLQTEIDWRLFVENTNIDDSIVAQQMRFVIDTTYGVVDSDFTNFSSNRDGRSIDFSGICFTVDCDNSQECFFI